MRTTLVKVWLWGTYGIHKYECVWDNFLKMLGIFREGKASMPSHYAMAENMSNS